MHRIRSHVCYLLKQKADNFPGYIIAMSITKTKSLLVACNRYSDFVFKIKQALLGMLSCDKYSFLIIEVTDFWDELTDVLARTNILLPDLAPCTTSPGFSQWKSDGPITWLMYLYMYFLKCKYRTHINIGISKRYLGIRAIINNPQGNGSCSMLANQHLLD